MKLWTLIGILLLTLAAPLASAQSGEEARQQIDESASRALQIMAQAHQYASRATNAQQADQAIALYIEAGKILEKVAQNYAQLVPQYASQEDVSNASKAMQTCMNSIKQLQQRFS